MKYKVAVVDDDPALVTILVQSLQSAGYVVESATEGKQAVNMLSKFKPDAVVLDWNLPEMSGLEICRLVRTQPATAKTPILMLTAFGEMRQKVSAFDTGADDYLTKPFEVPELLARVKSLLRRGGSAESYSELMHCGPIELNVAEHRVTVNKKEIELRPKEFELLHVLMSASGRLVSRKQLLERVWGYGQDITSRTVDSHIARLREKLGSEAAQLIETVPGFGYKLEKK